MTTDTRDITGRNARGDHDSATDLQAVKDNVKGIAKNIRDASSGKAQEANDYMHDRMDDMKDAGTDSLAKLEAGIKANPGQSVAIAFAAGIVASFLFGRK